MLRVGYGLHLGTAPGVAMTLRGKKVANYCPSSPLHLRQGSLHLRKPERHLHGSVQRDGSAQGGGSRRPLAVCGIQRTQAEVAVGLEWAHAKFVGQGEGLAVVSLGLLALRELAMRCTLTEEQWRVSLL